MMAPAQAGSAVLTALRLLIVEGNDPIAAPPQDGLERKGLW